MNLADELIRRAIYHVPVHDECWPHPWLCGNCPYMNVGPVCTKCASPLFEARLLCWPPPPPYFDGETPGFKWTDAEFMEAGRLKATV